MPASPHLGGIRIRAGIVSESETIPAQITAGTAQAVRSSDPLWDDGGW